MELNELGSVKTSYRVINGVPHVINLYTKKQRKYIVDTVLEKSKDVPIRTALKSLGLRHEIFYLWLKKEKMNKLKEQEELKLKKEAEKEELKLKKEKEKLNNSQPIKKTTKMEYTILKDSTSSGLIESVKKHISDGWKPVGGHQVVVTQTIDKYSGSQHMSTLSTIVYSQTMIKE